MLDLNPITQRKGAEAQHVLDAEIFQEAMEAVRQQYLSEWEHSKLKDSEARETAYMAVRLLKEIEGQLRTYVSNALFEQKQP